MAKENRVIFALECSVCHERNYSTTKNIKTQKDRMELKKFCKRCKKHEMHKESK